MQYLLFNEKKRRLFTRLALLLALISAGLVLFCFTAVFEGLIWHRAPTHFTVFAQDGEAVLFKDSEERFYSSEKEERVILQNGSDKKITVFFGNEKISLSPFEKKEVSHPYPCPIILLSDEKTTFFVKDQAELQAALSHTGTKDVVLLNDINTDKTMQLSSSCRIDMQGFAITGEGLSFTSDKKDTLVILSQSKSALFLQCDAPRSKLYVARDTLATDTELLDFYIKTESLNGETVDQKSYPVESFEMLLELSKRRLSYDSHIKLVDSFSLKDDICFDFICNISFEKELDYQGHCLKFESDEKASVVIDTKQKQDNSRLSFQCPNTALSWIGKGVPDAPELCESSRLDTLNGVKLDAYILGGNAKNKILSFKVRHEDLTRPIEYTVEGNLIIGTLDYLDDYYALENATVEIELDFGSYSFNEDILNSDSTADLTKYATLTLTDEDNCQTKYLIKTVREYKSLPVIEIVTDGRCSVDDRKNYVDATFTLHGNSSGFSSLEETPVQIRGRGNSTWDWEKKPYKLKFSEDISLFGLSASNQWALLANYADKSLIRNRLAYEMGKLLSFEYTPTQYAVDVFFNGVYQGVYTFGEHLEAAEGRVELNKSYNAKDSGYLIEVGGVDSSIHKLGIDYFHAGSIRFALCKSPGKGELTSTQFDYISRLLQSADRAVMNEGDWRSYLDEETLIDWILIMELTNNTDGAFRRSCYYTKNPDTLLMMGPIWDFDLAFGNFNRDDSDYDSWATTTDDDYVGITWTAHLLQDKEFVDAMYQRWQEIKAPLLSRAMEVLSEAEETVSPSAEENFKRWDTLNIRTTMQRSDVVRYNTYSKQLQYIRDFLTDRAEWMDGELQRLHDGGKYEIPVIEEEED